MDKVEPKGTKPGMGVSKAEKKRLPGDDFIKLALLFCHFVGFAAWYGAAFLGLGVTALFPWLAIGSGILLLVRQLYKMGFRWFILMEGILTLVTIVMTVLAFLMTNNAFIFLTVAIILGAASSHLPRDLREYALFGRKR
jgi:hypothetical protein